MKNLVRYAFVLAALLMVASVAQADPCLSNPADTVGNPGLGATVGTFIALGINPAVTCIENGIWTDPVNFGLGTYIQGAEDQGRGVNNAVLGSYVLDPASERANDANGRDFKWVQDNGNQVTFSPGVVGGRPSQGIIWDLGGQANQAVIFVFVDHGPVPGEVLENTVWLSDDPNAADAGWTQASLVHVYGAGWSPDPNISDGFAVVYQLPSSATFRYVSVTWGGPGAVLRDGDNEIDAVGGLTESGVGVAPVPEPSSMILFGTAALAAGIFRRRSAKA